MVYCTHLELEEDLSRKEIIQLTDDTNTGTWNTTLIDSFIKKAQSLIDPYCQEKYSVPFNPVPDVINTLCRAIVIYYCFLRRKKVSETWQKVYDGTIESLEKISKGTMSLGVPTVDTQPAQKTIEFTSKEKDDRLLDDPQGYFT